MHWRWEKSLRFGSLTGPKNFPMSLLFLKSYIKASKGPHSESKIFFRIREVMEVICLKWRLSVQGFISLWIKLWSWNCRHDTLSDNSQKLDDESLVILDKGQLGKVGWTSVTQVSFWPWFFPTKISWHNQVVNLNLDWNQQLRPHTEHFFHNTHRDEAISIKFSGNKASQMNHQMNPNLKKTHP